MLRKNKSRKAAAVGGQFTIVASEYNRRYVDAMVRAARRELTKAAGAGSVRVIRVPGAFEIPVVAAKLASAQARLSAIICLGVIFRGETTHARQIGDAVSLALAQIQVAHLTPIIHGVYVFENVEQARVRCLSTRHGRGIEAARTALAMAGVMAAL